MTLQSILPLGALTCLLTVAWAAPVPVPPEILACASEPDATRRLACYDRQVRALSRQQQGPDTAVSPGPPQSPAPVIKPSDAEAPVANDSSPLNEEFGRDSLAKGAGERAQSKPQRLSASIESTSGQNEGRLTLRLDNGQVWAQSEEGPDLKLKVGDKVIITRGLLGSYWLSNGSRLAIKVRRTH
jgi:hypothetical protein